MTRRKNEQLHGHDHATTVMSTVCHHMSDILPHPHENEEEIGGGQETHETPDEDKVFMARVKFMSLIAKALEDQKNLADETNAGAVKVEFTNGVKHGSERLTQLSHSSPMEFETVHFVHYD